MNFYGTTQVRESDRHKWFYSPSDAKRLIEYKCKEHGFDIIDFQAEHVPLFGSGKTAGLKRTLFKKIFSVKVNISDFESSTMWWVWERSQK